MADKKKTGFLEALKSSLQPMAERAGGKTKRRRHKIGFMGSKAKGGSIDEKKPILESTIRREILKRDGS